jgi:hypothetical protein
MSKRIFDCFTFFNETDLLEIRLNELYEEVDYFVICESTQTFQGQSKRLFFQENRDRFSKFLSKIIHVVVDDMPDTDNPWDREHFQRNSLRRGLVGLEPEDIVIISDLDEIVRPSTVQELRRKSGYFLIEMQMYQFYLNMQAVREWNKVFAFSHRLSGQLPDLSGIRVRQIETFEKFAGDAHKILDAGWHFTYLGGAEKVREKLGAYSHTGGYFEAMQNAGETERQLAAGYSVGGRALLKWCEIDETYPMTILDNLDKYKAKGFVKDLKVRVDDLERVFLETEDKARASEEKYRKILGEISSLVERAHEMALPYARSEFRGALEAGKNLIGCASRFQGTWHTGTQRVPEKPVTHIPYVLLGNLVLAHQRGDATVPDNNMGRYNVNGLIPGVRYTASCWIWLPADSAVESVMLATEGLTVIARDYADLKTRDGWQRISTCGECGHSRTDTNIVLRASAEPGALLYTTCWQLEVGDAATPYRPTDG